MITSTDHEILDAIFREFTFPVFRVRGTSYIGVARQLGITVEKLHSFLATPAVKEIISGWSLEFIDEHGALFIVNIRPWKRRPRHCGPAACAFCHVKSDQLLPVFDEYGDRIEGWNVHQQCKRALRRELGRMNHGK